MSSDKGSKKKFNILLKDYIYSWFNILKIGFSFLLLFIIVFSIIGNTQIVVCLSFVMVLSVILASFLNFMGFIFELFSFWFPEQDSNTKHDDKSKVNAKVRKDSKRVKVERNEERGNVYDDYYYEYEEKVYDRGNIENEDEDNIEESGNTESSYEQTAFSNPKNNNGIESNNRSEIGEKANDKDIKQIDYNQGNTVILDKKDAYEKRNSR